MKNKLKDFRKQIDSLDGRIINLLARRLSIVEEVGKWKKQKELSALDQVRFRKILISRTKKGKALGVNPELIKKIFEVIHEEALKIEKSL